MQDVQTRMRLLAPLTRARTVCRFRFQRRLVTLWAWLILLPNCGPRPHTSHTLAMTTESPSKLVNRYFNKQMGANANLPRRALRWIVTHTGFRQSTGDGY